MNKSVNEIADVRSEPPKKPIGVIASLAGGLDTVIQGWWIMLFPLALDLFLWFGAQLSVRPIAEQVVNDLVNLAGPNQLFDLILQAATELNYFSLISVAPLGIPSLMTVKLPHGTPLGPPSILTVDNELVWFAIFFGLSVVGLLLGGFYMGLIAQQVRDKQANLKRLLKLVPRYWVYTLAMIVGLLIVAAILAVPLMILATLLATLNTSIASLVIWIGFMILMWLIFHLVFTVHAMLLSEMNLPQALWTSVRLTTYNSFPTMGLMVLFVAISTGMNYLWSLPAENSWMLLVGVIGHAVISSGLVASTFIFYQDRHRYWRQLRAYLSNSAARSQ